MYMHLNKVIKISLSLEPNKVLSNCVFSFMKDI